jgi:hypothetical protein
MNACNTTLVASLLCAAGIVAAQDSDEVSSGVAACAAIESAVARLDCFDDLARSTRAANAPPADSMNRVSRRDARAAQRQEHEVTGRVAAVREILPGRIEVTLTNGQVWRQTNSDRYNLLVGHEVRIYPTGFGQYFRLSAKELRNFIQVERVQ